MINERDREVLSALEASQRLSKREWARPMDCGGRDGSHHGATLARLARRGLALRRARPTLRNALGPIRTTWEYQISDQGRAALKMEGQS